MGSLVGDNVKRGRGWGWADKIVAYNATLFGKHLTWPSAQLLADWILSRHIWEGCGDNVKGVVMWAEEKIIFARRWNMHPPIWRASGEMSSLGWEVSKTLETLFSISNVAAISEGAFQMNVKHMFCRCLVDNSLVRFLRHRWLDNSPE